MPVEPVEKFARGLPVAPCLSWAHTQHAHKRRSANRRDAGISRSNHRSARM